MARRNAEGRSVEEKSEGADLELHYQRLPKLPRLLEEVLDFEILLKMLHHCGIDARSKRKPSRSKFKRLPLRCDGVGEGASNGSIEHLSERGT